MENFILISFTHEICHRSAEITPDATKKYMFTISGYHLCLATRDLREDAICIENIKCMKMAEEK
jgi:hypothetical protein